MFDEHIYTILGLELAYEARVPEPMSALKFSQHQDPTDHSSLAIPKSLQHRIKALLLHASVAVAIPAASKYSCSPRAMATSLQRPQKCL